MVVKKDYIPRTDDKLLEWGKNFMGYVGMNIDRFKVPSPGDQMYNTLNSFEVLLKRCQSPNRGKVDTFEKNEARRRFVNEFRTYVQGFIAKNPFVSNADREKMPQPEHGSQLTKSRFTHHRKEKFEFAHDDVKKMAYFAIRYENSKGQAGPWGPVIAAIIP